VTLSELASIDNDFAEAIKMLLVRANLEGASTLPMADLVDMLDRLGYSAQGQERGIRDYIATVKNRNPSLVADVNDDEVIMTTMTSPEDESEENEDKVSKMALKQVRKAMGL
jgi:hypothetical protein